MPKKRETAVTIERKEIVGLVQQLKDLHKDNRSVVTTLDFLVDCINQREGK